MSVSFEQEITKPLISNLEDHNEPLKTKPSGLSPSMMGQSMLIDTLSIKYDRSQTSIDFINGLSLYYPPEKLTKLSQEIGSYVFYFTVKITENRKEWR